MYVLTRTVRSCIQYNASQDLGCYGQDNQCVRGECMAKAMNMFCGKNVEGIPRPVVWALIAYPTRMQV